MTDDERKQVATKLTRLFESFRQNVDTDPKLRLETYLTVIDNLVSREESIAATDVYWAIDFIMAGEGQHASRSFVPSTAELCSEIRARSKMREALAKRDKNTGGKPVKSAETFA